MSMQTGDRVKVQSSVIVYHHPEHRNRPYDIQGLEGEVIAVKTDWEGRVISPNYPIQVKFDKRFRAHFSQDEVAVA